jgi:PAS domain S-box-containing protein
MERGWTSNHAPGDAPMGDRRFDPVFERVKNAEDRVREIHALTDDEVIAALGGATQDGDLLLANILATEAQNRAHRATELTAALGEGVIVMNSAWHITMQNPAAQRMLGWTSDEFIGHDPHALIHPFCSEPEACHLGSLPPPDFFYQNDDALVMRKDGRTIRVAYTITPMLRNGDVDGGVLILRDSSERKRQEEKASERQDRLEMILETLSEGILTMDLAGRITYANAAAERILGRAARDITERTYFDPTWNFVTLAGEVLPVTDLPFMKAISSGEATLNAKLGVARGDGKVIHLTLNTVPLPDATGDTYALLVSFQEIAGEGPAAR